MKTDTKNVPPVGHSPIIQFADFPYSSSSKPTPYRSSHTCLLWLKEGTASIRVEQSDFDLSPNTWVFLSPYQPFYTTQGKALMGCALYFHYDFFCLEANGVEVGCNEVLFNTPYRSPLVKPNPAETADLAWLMDGIRREALSTDIASDTLIVSYIKSLLVIATRAKLAEDADSTPAVTSDSLVTSKLRRLIDEHYKDKTTLSEYAKMLKLSPRALERLIKVHWAKPLSQVIQERLMIEAKRELYLSSKPIKIIASELGFNDEYYFSRFFKKLAGVSPRGYRETVGMGRG
jgi:AraC family transcriptional regulator, transcriptional activator of pobA